MDNVVSEDRISSQAVIKLAEVLVKFHKSTHANDRILHFSQPRVIRKKIYENFSTLSKLARLQPEFVRKLISFVIDRKALFYHRLMNQKYAKFMEICI